MASLSETMAYLAGLFDGEGCITYKQRTEHRKGKPKAYKYWNIRIEINMTSRETIAFAISNASLKLLRHLYCILCSFLGFKYTLPPNVSAHHCIVGLCVITISICIRPQKYLSCLSFRFRSQYCLYVTQPSPSSRPAR